MQIIRKILKNILYVITVIIVQGWQSLGVVVIAILNDRPWECLFIFIGFVMGRSLFGSSYHAKSVIVCTLITWTVFYFLTSSVPSFKVSITIPCILGLSVSYMLVHIGRYIEMLKECE